VEKITRAAVLRAGRRGLVCAATALLLLGGTCYADPHADKTRVDQQLAETQSTLEAATDKAQQAAVEHDQAVAAMPGAQAALADAQGRVIGAQAGVRQAQRDVQEAREAQRQADAAYDAAAVQVDQGRAAVSRFVAEAYKGTGFLMINSVLESGDPSDLATRIGYLNQVAHSQQAALATLTGARLTAKQRSGAAQLAERNAADAARNAVQALAATMNAQNAAQAAAAQVQSLVNQTAQADAVASQERAAVLARYNELKTESDQIAAQLRALATQEAGHSTSRHPAPAAPPPLRPGAFFPMPVHGWKSSNFGMRYDPYYHVYQLHAGVDLAAAGGTPIAAVADGTVVRAGWYGGYGNYTCLSHGMYQGKGLATCYGHQSQILVRVGQTVTRGQIIGKVGTTGASTGYHLHFEVRLSGTPVDPLSWLPACLC
jgi:murein DD-endopeptidase MepM/ murein hydrolase activator NlpD